MYVCDEHSGQRRRVDGLNAALNLGTRDVGVLLCFFVVGGFD